MKSLGMIAFNLVFIKRGTFVFNYRRVFFSRTSKKAHNNFVLIKTKPNFSVTIAGTKSRSLWFRPRYSKTLIISLKIHVSMWYEYKVSPSFSLSFCHSFLTRNYWVTFSSWIRFAYRKTLQCTTTDRACIFISYFLTYIPHRTSIMNAVR